MAENESSVEVKCIADGAWYDGSLRREGKQIRVHFANFEPEDDEMWEEETIMDPAALKSSVRFSSEQLQDSSCYLVEKDLAVCGCLDNGRDRKYFDATIVQVDRGRHVLEKDGEEICTCRFKLRWNAGPKKGRQATLGCPDICLPSIRPVEEHPMIRRLLAPDLDVERPEGSRKKGKKSKEPITPPKSPPNSRKSQECNTAPGKKRVQSEGGVTGRVTRRKSKVGDVPASEGTRLNTEETGKPAEMMKPIEVQEIIKDVVGDIAKEMGGVESEDRALEVSAGPAGESSYLQDQPTELRSMWGRGKRKHHPTEDAADLVEHAKKVCSNLSNMEGMLHSLTQHFQTVVQGESLLNMQSQTVVHGDTQHDSRVVNCSTADGAAIRSDRPETPPAAQVLTRNVSKSATAAREVVDKSPDLVCLSDDDDEASSKRVRSLHLTSGVAGEPRSQANDVRDRLRGTKESLLLAKRSELGGPSKNGETIQVDSGDSRHGVHLADQVPTFHSLMSAEAAHGAGNLLKASPDPLPYASRMVLIENMEVDASVSDAMEVLGKLTEGVNAVHILPSGDCEASTNGYVLYKDSESAQAAAAALRATECIVASASGRPWIISNASANPEQRMGAGFATKSAVKIQEDGVCGIIAHQPSFGGLRILSPQMKEFTLSMKLMELFEAHRKQRRQMFTRFALEEEQCRTEMNRCS